METPANSGVLSSEGRETLAKYARKCFARTPSVNNAFCEIQQHFNTPTLSDEQLKAFVENEFHAFKASAPDPVKAPTKSRRSTARSKETWRIIDDYPDYEVSSQGRARSLKRVEAAVVLAPHFRRFGKMWVPYYSLYKDGQKKTVQAGWLRVAAGFQKA